MFTFMYTPYHRSKTGIFHMPSEYFFQQLVEPPLLPNAVHLVTCYVLFETVLRKIRL
jgi:hypothetical protein